MTMVVRISRIMVGGEAQPGMWTNIRRRKRRKRMEVDMDMEVEEMCPSTNFSRRHTLTYHRTNRRCVIFLVLNDVNILTSTQVLSSTLSPVSPSSSPSSYLATLPRVTRRLFRWTLHTLYFMFVVFPRNLTSLSADSDTRKIHLKLYLPIRFKIYPNLKFRSEANLPRAVSTPRLNERQPPRSYLP